MKTIQPSVLRKTGYKDCADNDIIEGDILVGKSDHLHKDTPMLLLPVRERDFVKMNLNPSVPEWLWNGHFLKSVAANVYKVGNIFDNPELLL